MSLQSIVGFAFCLVALLVVGCDSGSPGVDTEDPDKAPVSVTPGDVMEPPPSQAEVVINHEGAAPDQWGSDDYDLETGEDIDTGEDQTPVLEGDTLTLTVSYGGSCGPNHFTLIADRAFRISSEESDPVELDVFLAHDDDDPCEAYPTERYAFDLTPIKELYQEAFDEEAGAVDLQLWDVDDNFLHEITYAFGEL